MKKPKTISIIGGTGQMGGIFAKEFRKKGYKVIISGRKTKISNIEATKRGDVVIVSVPIRATGKIIKEIGPYVRPGCLLTDFTSVKILPSKAMEISTKAEIIGGHPLFGPNSNPKNKTFVLCPVRGKSYIKWYKSFLQSIGMNVVEITADEHDQQMAVIQCLNHLSNISLAHTLKNLGFDLKKSKPLFTPAYFLRIYPVGRMLSQSPELYADIETYNPYSKQASKAFLKSVKRIHKDIKKENKNDIEDLIKELQLYFKPLIKESVKITQKMIKDIMENENGKK